MKRGAPHSRRPARIRALHWPGEPKRNPGRRPGLLRLRRVKKYGMSPFDKLLTASHLPSILFGPVRIDPGDKASIVMGGGAVSWHITNANGKDETIQVYP